MMGITNNNWHAISDTALLSIFGSFIKHKRIEQNKTQSQLAEEAGINRATLSLFENGGSINLLTFIQLLRSLNLLYLLKDFQITQQLSPIQLAKLEKSKRIRASRSKKQTPKSKSDW